MQTEGVILNVMKSMQYTSSNKQQMVKRTNEGTDSWVTKAWTSMFNLSETNEEIDSTPLAEKRESSFDVFTAQTSKTFLGKSDFLSLVRWRISLKIAKNGEIPLPPATNISFSYLKEDKSSQIIPLENSQ